MLTKYVYAQGYKSRYEAELALEDMIAEDVISECENPEIKGYYYNTDRSELRWCIMLEH
jgi:hypothetical protein